MDIQSKEYEIIQYRPEFKSQVLELQTHMWSPDLGTNAAYLEWKYYNNPYVQKPILYLAMHGEQVVGMRGMFGTCWQAGLPGQTFRCLVDADAVVHPEHRRRGLLERLTTTTLADLASGDYEYIVTLSSNQFSSANNLKLGWRSVGLLQAMQRQAGPRQPSGVRRVARSLPLVRAAYRHLRGYVGRQLAPSLDRPSLFDALDRNSAQARPGALAHVCVEKAPRPEAMAGLVDRIGYDGRIRHVRDRQFFAWRFQNPLSVYRFLFWQDAGLEGYLVLHTNAYAGEGAWVSIVDWEAANLQARADLLQAAIRWGDFDVLTVWSATLQDEIKGLLGEQGFCFLGETENVTYRPSLLVQSARPEAQQLDWALAGRRMLDISNWDLRAIDSDDY